MSDRETDDLPLPDYDHHTTGSLEPQLHALGPTEVETLLTYEREHAGRVPMLNLLERRLEALRRGASVGDASPSAPGPQTAVRDPGGSPGKVGPATSGPPVNPPSHGDPTNPAQPRT